MKIRRIACVGAGLIGHSWATLFAWKGYEVFLQDISEAALQSALSNIKKNFEFLVQKGILDDRICLEAFDRIRITRSLEEAVKDSDYVQESIFEEYGAKRKVFRLMDAMAPPDTILASSTSTLRISKIQKAVKRPEKCITVHPWNPPHLMPLVEIVPGRATSQQTVEEARSLMEKLGKIVVLQKKEIPGTIGNRLAAALWREAIDLVDKGVASLEDIDKAVSAGPGLRWAILGPHISYHLAGGKGGIEYYLRHLGPAMEDRWKSLAKWTSIPPSAREKLVEGIKAYGPLKERPAEEMARWRDEKLIELLKILYKQSL
jgi:3-hydroxypropionate dehydrogenase (NADP+)